MSSRLTPAPATVRRVLDLSIGIIDRVAEIPVDSVRRSPYQSRISADQESIATLAQSILDNDLASPILVRPIANDLYELVCGETRWEAHKLLGRKVINATVRILSDVAAARLLAADNQQRRELSDFEICMTVNMLLENKFIKTDAEIARLLGRSRVYIAKVRAFNDLPDGAHAIITQAPERFGANLASELRASGFNTTHPKLVLDSLAKVISGSLTQAGVLTWLRSQTKPDRSSALKDSTIKIGSRRVRITVYQNTIRISCDGMDSLALEPALQETLRNHLGVLKEHH